MHTVLIWIIAKTIEIHFANFEKGVFYLSQQILNVYQNH